MKKEKKELAIGFIVALLATIAGFVLYLEIFAKEGYGKTIGLIQEGRLYGEIISLSAIPNLFVFFVYLKKKQDLRAKGVLIATICIALFTLVLKIVQ